MTHCQGQKGGQSPLSSVYYKKEKRGYILKNIFGKNSCKSIKGVKSQKKFLEKIYKN